MSQIFLESNTPRLVSDLFAVHSEIKTLTDWLNDYANKKPATCKACLICGDVGVGKSTLASVILKQLQYTVLEYSATEFRGSRQLKDTLNHIIEDTNVSRALNPDGHENKKMAIIIDHVEGISIVEKNGLTELIHAINPLRGKRSVKKIERERIANTWSVPIICISSESSDKRSLELKKDCLFLEMHGWTRTERSDFVRLMFMRNGKQIAEGELDCVVDICGSDIRKILHVLFEAFLHTDIRSFIGHYKREGLSAKSDVYSDTRKALFEDVGVKDSLSLYNRHRMLLPLMLHENYPKMIENIPEAKKLNTALQVMDGITLSDQIDNFIYDSQSWNLPPYSAMAGVLLPNLILKKYANPKKPFAIKFTTNLSKTSLQYTNIKIINAFIYRTLNPTFSWEDLITLCQIYEKLKDCDPTAAERLLTAYKFSDDIILKIRKANKVDNEADVLQDVHA